MLRSEGTRYGRTRGEWAELVDAGRQFLMAQARKGWTTSYTELNSVFLHRRSVRPFDFDLDSERAAMGELLYEIVMAERPASGRMLSAIVLYLNDNSPGPGFFKLATELGELAPGASSDDKSPSGSVK